jgi:hypothetical protein
MRGSRAGVQHLPELRMNGRLAADELHRIEGAFLLQQVGDVLAERLHRQDAVSLGIGVADTAREVARVRHFHEHGAGLVAALVARVVRPVTGRHGPAGGAGATAAAVAESGCLHDVVFGVATAPLILVRQPVVAGIVLEQGAAQTVRWHLLLMTTCPRRCTRRLARVRGIADRGSVCLEQRRARRASSNLDVQRASCNSRAAGSASS